jgi:hypothetical protein
LIDELVAPLFQTYDPPGADGVAVRAVLLPLQIAATLATFTLGIEFTVTVAVAEVAAQPPMFTVTVYVVVAIGLTVSVCVVAPVFQE